MSPASSVGSAIFVLSSDLHNHRTPPFKRPLPARCVASHKLRGSVPVRDSISCPAPSMQDFEEMVPDACGLIDIGDAISLPA